MLLVHRHVTRLVVNLILKDSIQNVYQNVCSQDASKTVAEWPMRKVPSIYTQELVLSCTNFSDIGMQVMHGLSTMGFWVQISLACSHSDGQQEGTPCCAPITSGIYSHLICHP